MISVVFLQNRMDLQNSEHGSSDDTYVTSTLGGNEVIGIETERISDISVVVFQEAKIPAKKTQPNVSCMPVVSFTYISCMLYPELPAPVSVSLCETKL